jgi:nicotinic acid phosphoribosyltransferase
MARRYQLRPVGTMAHEFIMAEGALNGYQGVNMRVLEKWETCFPKNPELWIALTDTFGTSRQEFSLALLVLRKKLLYSTNSSFFYLAVIRALLR